MKASTAMEGICGMLLRYINIYHLTIAASLESPDVVEDRHDGNVAKHKFDGGSYLSFKKKW